MRIFGDNGRMYMPAIKNTIEIFGDVGLCYTLQLVSIRTFEDRSITYENYKINPTSIKFSEIKRK